MLRSLCPNPSSTKAQRGDLRRSSEWQDPGPLTSGTLGYSDDALPGNHISGQRGQGWCKAEEVRPGCWVQGWLHAEPSSRLGQVCMAQHFKCILMYWNRLRKKIGFCLLLQFKRRGEITNTSFPLVREHPFEKINQMFSAKACTGPHFPKLYQLS